MVAPSPVSAGTEGPRARFARGLPFALTVFLSAFLLFQVQLVITKCLLPWFGGVAAVFTTCMLFFQVALLAGYFYAHLLMHGHPRTQRIVHVSLLITGVVVIAVLALHWPAPLLPSPAWKPADANAPTARLLLLLAASVGLPYFALSTTGPLLQAWWAQAERRSPYRWYALSNLGSLLGLVTYPTVFERLLTLRVQAWVWTAAFAVFSIMCAITAMTTARTTPARSIAGGPAERIGITRRLFWFLLPACAVVVLLAATNQICQEVASVPFLWVLPLTLYLVSFIVCFDHPRRYSRSFWTALLALSTSGVCFALYSRMSGVGMVVQIGLYALFVLACSMMCHGEVYRLKPAASALTSFYLTISAGGAAAGLFVGVVAPRVFSGYWELHLGVWLTWLLFFLVLLTDRTSWVHATPSWAPIVAFAVIAAGPVLAWYQELAQHSEVLVFSVVLVLLVVIFYRAGAAAARIKWGLLVPGSLIALGLVLLGDVDLGMTGAVARTRNFYGALAVVDHYQNDPELHSRLLRHGAIVHGLQYFAPGHRDMPTTYFGPHSGVGVAVLNAQQHTANLRIGVIGLGVGTIAAYGRTGDYVRFYEINPEVLRIAREYFSYLADSRAQVDIVLGDARLSMERELGAGRPQHFDVLALDAFNSDSIPVHLLTREAFAIYLREIKPDGIVAVHISNKTLDLKPVVQAAAAHFGLAAAWIDVTETADPMHYMSSWVLLSRDPAVLSQRAIAAAAKPFPSPPGRLWTDDYSNLLSAVRR